MISKLGQYATNPAPGGDNPEHGTHDWLEHAQRDASPSPRTPIRGESNPARLSDAPLLRHALAGEVENAGQSCRGRKRQRLDSLSPEGGERDGANVYGPEGAAPPGPRTEEGHEPLQTARTDYAPPPYPATLNPDAMAAASWAASAGAASASHVAQTFNEAAQTVANATLHNNDLANQRMTSTWPQTGALQSHAPLEVPIRYGLEPGVSLQSTVPGALETNKQHAPRGQQRPDPGLDEHIRRATEEYYAMLAESRGEDAANQVPAPVGYQGALSPSVGMAQTNAAIQSQWNAWPVQLGMQQNAAPTNYTQPTPQTSSTGRVLDEDLERRAQYTMRHDPFSPPVPNGVAHFVIPAPRPKMYRAETPTVAQRMRTPRDAERMDIDAPKPAKGASRSETAQTDPTRNEPANALFPGVPSFTQTGPAQQTPAEPVEAHRAAQLTERAESEEPEEEPPRFARRGNLLVLLPPARRLPDEARDAPERHRAGRGGRQKDGLDEAAVRREQERHALLRRSR